MRNNEELVRKAQKYNHLRAAVNLKNDYTGETTARIGQKKQCLKDAQTILQQRPMLDFEDLNV